MSDALGDCVWLRGSEWDSAGCRLFLEDPVCFLKTWLLFRRVLSLTSVTLADSAAYKREEKEKKNMMLWLLMHYYSVLLSSKAGSIPAPSFYRHVFP